MRTREALKHGVLAVAIGASLIAATIGLQHCTFAVEPFDNDVETVLESLTITTNNSCLSNTGCSTPAATSIASDSSNKRKCMRGYFKKKTRDLFTCPTANGQGDKCYRGTPNQAPDLYQATHCEDFGVTVIGGVNQTTRKCSLDRLGNPNNGGSGSEREAFMFYGDGVGASRCELYEVGHSQPTQLVVYNENKLYSPPP